VKIRVYYALNPEPVSPPDSHNWVTSMYAATSPVLQPSIAEVLAQ
jgi:hypothetical protein